MQRLTQMSMYLSWHLHEAFCRPFMLWYKSTIWQLLTYCMNSRFGQMSENGSFLKDFVNIIYKRYISSVKKKFHLVFPLAGHEVTSLLYYYNCSSLKPQRVSNHTGLCVSVSVCVCVCVCVFQSEMIQSMLSEKPEERPEARKLKTDLERSLEILKTMQLDSKTVWLLQRNTEKSWHAWFNYSTSLSVNLGRL